MARAGVIGGARDPFDDLWFNHVRTIATPHVMKPFGRYPAQQFNSGVQYFNGRVEVRPKVYLFFWSSETGGDPSGTARI